MAVHRTRVPVVGESPEPSQVVMHMRYRMTVGENNDGSVTLTFTDDDNTAHAYQIPRHAVVGLQHKLDNVLDKHTNGGN